MLHLLVKINVRGIFQKERTSNKLRILTKNDFWDVNRWLARAYAPSSDHLD